MNSLFRVVIAAAIWLRMAAAEPRNLNRNPIPRQTLAPKHDSREAAPTPTSAPEGKLELRAADLAARTLGMNTCGIVTLPWYTYPLACASTQPCQTASNYMLCGTVVSDRCYDGTAAVCKSSSIGPNTRCWHVHDLLHKTNSMANIRVHSTIMDGTWLPKCVTYYKDIDRNNWIWYLGCQLELHSGLTSIVLVPETVEDNFLDGSQTTLASTDSTASSIDITLTSSTSASASSSVSHNADPSPTSSPASASSDIPAIVGGVIGGVAVVMIGVCVVVWLIVRKKRASRAQDVTSASHNPTQGAQMPSQPEIALSLGHQPQYAGFAERYKYQSVSATSPSLQSEAYLAPSPSPRNTASSGNGVVEMG
ncbi:hypothetical protein CORC01_08621 [Colletotrichum orchidophilum]|uniref:Uncharacterized protein n=1 Tax=Colletotrichum orchidophilum TaxID=1209926 RepID=A0A1G4B3W3_9PEZI|nr:uncharacterized protein CORC01_08621 [Colletotrichum orchidophilum]OHE96084.1 hypothetical protein CORC01_08621 [Colletotrichum orchidophilum]